MTGLLLLAILSLGRAVHFAFFSPVGGIDFYGFWRAGLFLRQSSDPYAAYLAGQTPATPIVYFDGAQANELPQDQFLSIAPTNTAPLILLISPLAWLSWPTAKLIWFGLNALLVLSLPWWALGLLPHARPLPQFALLSLGLAFYAFKSTRGALGTGQTTVVVFTLMLICVLIWDNHPLWAGVALGMALSKYSVALPLLLYALYQRHFRVVAVSLLVQLAGVLAITLLAGTSPLGVVESYYRIMRVHADAPGFHLASLFATTDPMRIIATLLLTIGCCAALGWLFLHRLVIGLSAAQRQFHDLHLFTALSLWTLLVAYHRPYDGMLVLLFLLLLLDGLYGSPGWQLTRWQRRMLLTFYIFVLAIFVVPYEEIGTFLPGIFTPTVRDALAICVTLTLVAMLGVTLGLLRLTRMQAQKAALATAA